MEQPADIQAICPLERVMRAFATAGRARWRHWLTDISELERLPAVQAELESLGSDLSGGSPLSRDADARRDAIEAAIRGAVGRLPDPFSAAALEHFGFANDDTDQIPRFVLAAARLGFTTDRWYDKPRNQPPYGGLKPRDYVIRLVTCGLAGIEDPVAYLTTSHTGPRAPSKTSPTRSRRMVDTVRPTDTPLADVVWIDVSAGAGEVLAAQAYRLGVRRSPAGAGFAVPPDESTTRVRLSRYVCRADLDDPLRAAVSGTFDSHGVHVITLEGFSYTGKSRALLQALIDQSRNFRFLAPHGATQLSALLDDQLDQAPLHTNAPTMLWLDPLEGFCGPLGGAWREQLRQHAERQAPIVLLAGLGGTAGVPVDAGTREFLQLEHPLDGLRDLGLSSIVTPVESGVTERGFEADRAIGEIQRTYDLAAKPRPGPWETAARDGGFLRALAHGGQLERRYRSGWPDPATIDPRGQAVAWAVMAWRRAVQSDDPVDLETIERLSQCSPLGSRGQIGSESQLNAAIDWACEPTPENASSLVSPVRQGGSTRAFRAEAFLAQALVQPHELTREAWSVIESAAPANRRATVRQGANVSAVQAHGTPKETDSAVDVSLRRPIATRGAGAAAGREAEPNAVTSVAFRTRGGLKGRLQAVENKLQLVLWSAPAHLATTETIAVRLAPASGNATPAESAEPVVVIAQSTDGFWELPTDLAVPRTPSAWRSLTESLRVALISPHPQGASAPGIDTPSQ